MKYLENHCSNGAVIVFSALYMYIPQPELEIIFTVVSVFTKQNFNLFSNLMSPFSIGTPEIQWLFSIFLTHNWSPKMSVYLFLSRVLAYNSGQQEDF